MIYEEMDFDVMIRSRDYLHFIDAGQVPQSALDLASSAGGVEAVTPFHVTLVNWRNPRNADLRGMVLMGVNPAGGAFASPAIAGDFDLLTSPEQVLVDTESSPEFGPADGRRFSSADVGVTTELAGRPVRIAGLFRLGTGLTANGSAITSTGGFIRMVPWDAIGRPGMGLVRVAAGVDPGEVASRIRRLNSDALGQPAVEVLTRQQVMDRELGRWIGETPIGFVFTLGVGIAFVVGAAIFYMVLSTDVANRLREYATLRAMGYPAPWMAGVVLRQAFWLALLAFVPAALISVVFYEVTSVLANIPIFMTVPRLVFVFLLSQLMCAVSGALALRKLWQAEPASLF
jgi:putative ABC transport system permease protein